MVELCCDGVLFTALAFHASYAVVFLLGKGISFETLLLRKKPLTAEVPKG